MGRRRRGVMSEELKYELAKDLGFYDTVMREGWEGIRTKDAGNMVKRAIQIAEEKLAQDYRRQQAGAGASAYGGQPVQQSGYVQLQPPFGTGAAAAAYRPGYAAAQPAPTYAYSRQSGFTPLYPSVYGYGYAPNIAAEQQPPAYIN
jgi:hypothetical protein